MGDLQLRITVCSFVPLFGSDIVVTFAKSRYEDIIRQQPGFIRNLQGRRTRILNAATKTPLQHFLRHGSEVCAQSVEAFTGLFLLLDLRLPCRFPLRHLRLAFRFQLRLDAFALRFALGALLLALGFAFRPDSFTFGRALFLGRLL